MIWSTDPQSDHARLLYKGSFHLQPLYAVEIQDTGIRVFLFSRLTKDFQSRVIKWSLAVEFNPLALKWELHAQIVSTCKRPFTFYFINFEKENPEG